MERLVNEGPVVGGTPLIDVLRRAARNRGHSGALQRILICTDGLFTDVNPRAMTAAEARGAASQIGPRLRGATVDFIDVDASDPDRGDYVESVRPLAGALLGGAGNPDGRLGRGARPRMAWEHDRRGERGGGMKNPFRRDLGGGGRSSLIERLGRRRGAYTIEIPEVGTGHYIFDPSDSCSVHSKRLEAWCDVEDFDAAREELHWHCMTLSQLGGEPERIPRDGDEADRGKAGEGHRPPAGRGGGRDRGGRRKRAVRSRKGEGPARSGRAGRRGGAAPRRAGRAKGRQAGRAARAVQRASPGGLACRWGSRASSG